MRPDLGLETSRAEVLHQAGITFGAPGGLAARSFAINEMLRRYEATLDNAHDFRALVLPLGPGQTLMRPPIVTQAQMAFALGDNGQVARETACIYQITREAELASAPPNWRSYLVRHWGWTARPSHAALPRTDQEVAYWTNMWPRLGTRREASGRELSLGSWVWSAISSAWRVIVFFCGQALLRIPR